MGATRQRTTRLSKERSPARPLSWAVPTTAATIGPKAPRNTAGTGSEEIRPRASRIASNQKNQVNAKAMTMYFSGKALVMVVRDGVAVVASIAKFLSLDVCCVDSVGDRKGAINSLPSRRSKRWPTPTIPDASLGRKRL